ncbi:DUF4286 family protein [Marinoscillum furvescens]|uniref:Uncharacterized protein DUF4286 n=1 Tax=Marinoscillum furvescens DSM 4134 TaxID=1122208 RepID=A0A3D9LHL2_MARFU|nr:DUF4286 family protein [Marinoscillum furvescens]REE05901.1 uncharacterized protein DUF4286 [Marinoscillum furvescens DSM 4134]
MILYNVTVSVAPQVEQDWLTWMKDVHIPEVMRTGCFAEHKFLRLLNESPEAEGSTYAVQYFAPGKAELDTYLADHAPALRQKHLERYQDKALAFRTLLEEI